MKMICQSCQFDNLEEANFCGQCGAKLELICSICNFSNPLQFKFCANCGHNLRMASPPVQKELSFDEKIEKIQRYLPEGLTEKILSQRDKIEGERRQVTVMFCDIAGFTTLVEKLGPEEAYGIMDQVYEILIEKVHDYEGTINEMTGDGIMALFGAPIALEDAPQRAIRTAYVIHREIARFNNRMKQEKQNIPLLKMRIGIHTGPVVVGALGNDLRVEFKVVGDTVNLASRMEGLAEPGSTYVTENTFKITEGFFRFEALGEHAVKGRTHPVKAYHVIAPSTRRTRFDVSAERGLTPFVGRRRELELLLDGFDRIKMGQGQAFSIISEAGVGKSRLLYEFRKAVATEDVTFMEGKCLSYSRGVTYYPIIDILKSSFEIQVGEEESNIREKVKNGLKAVGIKEASTLPFLLELLSVKESGIDEIFISPEAMENKIIETLKRIIIKGADFRPLIMAVEDLHWIDKSSEDVLKEFLDTISGVRVFLIFTYRPDFTPTWGIKSYHNQINLNRLFHRETLMMTRHILGTDRIHKDLEELILEKTEGVPFFIEEFLKSLKDLKIIERENNQFLLSKDVEEITIPSTIHDVVMARVDSLPKVSREILQMGSVIGREFGYEMIKLTMDLGENDLLSHVSFLKDSELVYERGVYPQLTYIFKHALIQDICFQSILKSICREYHRKIANVMEQYFPEIYKEHPEILGHHLTEAGIAEQAIPYWQKAGEIAIRRSANLEAIDHLNKALAIIEGLPEKSKHLQPELELQITLGSALMAVKGYSASEVGKAYARARELCQQVGETPQLFAILRGLWGFYIVRDELQTAHELGKRCLAMAKRPQKPAHVLWTYFMLGMTLLHFGEFASAREYLEKGISLYDIQKRRSHRALQDPGVACLSYLSLALWFLGYPDQALKKSSEALTLAHKLSHPFSLAYALNIASIVCQLCRNVEETQKHAETAITLCTEQGIPYWLAYGPILRGWALAEKGKRNEGIRQTRQGIAAYSDTGAVLGRPYFLSMLIEAYIKEKQAKEGLTVLDEAQAIVNETRECWVEAELYRLKGKLLLEITSDNYHETEACFHQAFAIARHQNAKSLELKAAMSLSCLWHRKGKKAAARKMLEEVYGWFTEGFDAPELKKARDLLNEFA
jgi:predicted ATPase/class 3 adenylate cyclase